MGVRFSSMGPNHAAALRHERIVLFGGSTIILTLIAVVALLIYSNTVVQAREDHVAQPAADTEIAFGTVVLIAPTVRVPKGSKITAEFLREINWPRDQVPEGAVRTLADAEGMYANVPLPANQPVLRNNIGSTPPSFGIGELLPAGHRAVTIEVNAITGIEGWATPGAHVDVFLTYLDPKEQVYKTRVAVEDAVVLSYGGQATKIEKNDLDKPNISSTVTLAVQFDDSLKIQTATAVGKITLALRNSTDLSSQGKAEFSANDWDSQRVEKKVERKFVANGFASYTDKAGSEKQFVLGQDNKWWVSSSDE